MSVPGACDGCLRRTWLVARLAGHIEAARRERRALREILALPDEVLLVALGGDVRADIEAEYAAVDPAVLRVIAAAAEVHPVCRHDDGFPDRLRDLVDVPASIFVRGGRRRLRQLVGGSLADGPPSVAIVGTRRASADGLEVARSLGRGLAAAGVTVVSGMAMGIDSAAHEGALKVGGPTVAVLAGGADLPYPRRKAGLYGRILEDGNVLSEMPAGFIPFRWCFPARNRLIAALAQMTIVVEAAGRSGSLITAELASDLGREVGAVPGPVLSWRSDGTNALLRDGATLVRDAGDALDAAIGVRPAIEAHLAVERLDPSLGSVLRAVRDGDDTVAALTRTLDDARATLLAVTELELLGLLRRVPGGRYVVVAP